MADRFVQLIQDIRIGFKYQLIELLGSGTFGKVYLGRDTSTLHDVAIKLEHYSVEPSLLGEEAEAYKSLSKHGGFPLIYWHGNQDDYQCLVMELLGPNLEDLLQYCGAHFSLKTTLMLADQLLQRFEALHGEGYLHRDVKPENFLMGTGQNGNIVYMTDLGLVATQLYEDNGVPLNRNRSGDAEPHLLGTCRFASIQGHIGRGISQQDDLEALGYMLVYFMKGKLPWQGLEAADEKTKYQKVLEMKRATRTEDLCAGLPRAFTAYFKYLTCLRKNEPPDHKHLRQIFTHLFVQEGLNEDSVFDWTILEYERLEALSRGKRQKKGKVKASTKS